MNTRNGILNIFDRSQGSDGLTIRRLSLVPFPAAPRAAVPSAAAAERSAARCNSSLGPRANPVERYSHECPIKGLTTGGGER